MSGIRKRVWRVEGEWEVITERLYMDGPGAVTLEDVLDTLADSRLQEWGYGDVQVHSISLSWRRPSTAEERNDWAMLQAHIAENHKLWECLDREHERGHNEEEQ